MTSIDSSSPASSGKLLWVGRILSAIPVLFLTVDAAMKIANLAVVVAASRQIGWPVELAPVLGLVELGCVLVYLVPRTSLLGAILLTGYLGGAVATNVRIGAPLASHVLFPVYVALLVWGGLVLRDGRLGQLLPWRSSRLMDSAQP
jgi:hypothetical protein